MATGSPGVFPKATGNIIYSADYNNVQSATEFLLGTGLADSGYGQTVSSTQVDATKKVSTTQWTALRGDLLKVRQHQTGVDESANLDLPTGSATGASWSATTNSTSLTITVPAANIVGGLIEPGFGVTGSGIPTGAQISTWTPGTNTLVLTLPTAQSVGSGSGVTLTFIKKVTDTFVNQYKDFATTCNTNRLTIASNQGTLSAYTSSTRTTSWNGTLTHTITITFASANAARYFWNAGGQFRFSASRSGGTVANKNTSWTNLLSDMGTITFNYGSTTYSGTGASTVETTTGWYQLGTTYTTVFVKPAAAGVYVENDYNIAVKRDVADNTATVLTVKIEFRDDDLGDQITGGVGGGGVDGLFAPLGPAVDENIDGTLTSSVSIFLPTGANVALTAPTSTQVGIA